MTQGELSFHNNEDQPLAEKVEAAAEYYRRKYGVRPTICLVHPAMLAKDPDAAVDGIEIKAGSPLVNHIWTGIQ